MKKHFLFIGALLCSTMVFGAGFQLNLQGMRQLAMGGTGAAIPWDASTIYYNPAGLVAIRNVQAYASMNLLQPRIRYTSAAPGSNMLDAKEQNYTPFNLYVGGPIAYKSRWSIGLGVYTPYGTGIDWGNDWEGRYVVQNIHLQSIFFQPTVSYEVSDQISVGGGFIYATGNLELQKAIPLANQLGQDGQASLTGRGSGVGFNLGVRLKPTEDFSVGITYRSQVNMKVKRGLAQFSVPPSLSGSFVETAFQSELPLPQVATVGFGWNVNDVLTLQFDANFTGWAAYDSLIFDYENNTDLLEDTRQGRRYRNTVSLRAGMNYKFSDRISGMLGTAYDPSPVRDGFLSPDLPDADRILATGGLSVQLFERLHVIGVVEYVFATVRSGYSREEGFAGRYQTKVINPGLGVTLDF